MGQNGLNPIYNNNTPKTFNTQSWDFVKDIVEMFAELGDISSTFLFDNNINNTNSFVFETLQDLQEALETKDNNISTNSEIIQQNNSEKILSVKVVRTGIFGSGIEVSVKVQNNNNIWSIANVTSQEYGFTFGWSFSQIEYIQNTDPNNTNVTILEVIGYENYNLFVEGIGTVYKDKVKIVIKINKNTGNVVNIQFINI